jgi:hypothetical protein
MGLLTSKDTHKKSELNGQSKTRTRRTHLPRCRTVFLEVRQIFSLPRSSFGINLHFSQSHSDIMYVTIVRFIEGTTTDDWFMNKLLLGRVYYYRVYTCCGFCILFCAGSLILVGTWT